MNLFLIINIIGSLAMLFIVGIIYYACFRDFYIFNSWEKVLIIIGTIFIALLMIFIELIMWEII